MPQANDVDTTLTETDVRLAGATQTVWARSQPRRLLAALVLGTIAIIAAIAFGSGGTETQVASEGATEIATQESPPPSVVSPEAEPRAEDDLPQAETAEATTEKEPVQAKPPAQKRTRSKQRAKAEPGTINLVTRGGWAEVYEGKKLLGSTPRRLTLSSGRHRLVLKPFGTEKPKTIYVTVEANKTKKISIALD
jgi:hypothetical protein